MILTNAHVTNDKNKKKNTKKLKDKIKSQRLNCFTFSLVHHLIKFFANENTYTAFMIVYVCARSFNVMIENKEKHYCKV